MSESLPPVHSHFPTHRISGLCQLDLVRLVVALGLAEGAVVAPDLHLAAAHALVLVGIAGWRAVGSVYDTV